MPRAYWAWLASAVLATTGPALAQEGPEQLEQIEPAAGKWQAEYYGTFGGDGEQSAELLAGVSGKLVVGTEIEFEGPRYGLRLDSIGAVVLYRAIDPGDHLIGLGFKLQASIGREGGYQGMEARAMVERRSADWWLQGDLILRNAWDDGADGTGMAYAASAQRSLSDVMWLGVEISGQVARLGGEAALAPAGRHYAGPSLTAELPIGGREVEVGLAWLQRVRGDGAGSGPRIFVQGNF